MATPPTPRVHTPYERFFGFVHPPFALAPDPRFFFQSTSHEDAIARLSSALERYEGFVVLTGDIGTGKTTVCRAVLQQMGPRSFTSLILNPFVSVDELLREVLLDFGVIAREAVRAGRAASASTHDLVSTLHAFLVSLVPLDGTAVLIIDEAQRLRPEVLEEIRLLSNLELNDRKLLQIVLVGQLDLLDTLARSDMRQLQQRVSLRAMLTPLSREESDAYIRHRLTVAGGTTELTFDPDALDIVHLGSGGVPRVINLLCDRALNVAAAQQGHRITEDHVRAAATELDIVLPDEAGNSPWAAPRSLWLTRSGRVSMAILAGLVLLWAWPRASWVEPRIPGYPATPRPVAGPPARALTVPPADLVMPVRHVLALED